MTVVLDGAMGTELAHRGFELCAPLWGARAITDAPALVSAIHRDYANHGAQALTTATFGLTPEHVALAAPAVALVREAAPSVTCVGGLGPADPRTPTADQRAHYLALGEALAEGGADVLFAETHTSVTTARLAAATLRAFDRPVWVAIACGVDGRSLSGDALGTPIGADVVFVGCSECAALGPALDALAPHNPVLGAKPSLALTRGGTFQPAGAEPQSVVDALVHSVERYDLQYVGGCCGTTPAFIAALSKALSR